MGISEDLTREKREAYERGFRDAVEMVRQKATDNDLQTLEWVNEVAEDILYDMFGYEEDLGNGIAY